MRSCSVAASTSPAVISAAANVRSFSRCATSLATTQSCCSRKDARAAPVDSLDQCTTRSYQPVGSTAVLTLTPWA